MFVNTFYWHTAPQPRTATHTNDDVTIQLW